MADATVVISTRNRLKHVRRAVASVLEQSIDLDVLVMDDASTDGTAAALRTEFPDVVVRSSAARRHQMAQRNEAMRLAMTELVICLDDDAYFTSPRTAEQTLTGFDHPRIAAVTMPYVNVLRETHLRHPAPPPGEAWAVGTFGAGACAFRRSAFLAVGGYREDLEYQAEEGDLALRLVAGGYVLRAGDADPLEHADFRPVKPARLYYLGARNEVLLAWLGVPQPYVLGRLATVAGRTVFVGAEKRHLLAAVRGVGAGLRTVWHHRHNRSPVSRQAYVLVRQLRRRGPQSLHEVLRRIS